MTPEQIKGTSKPMGLQVQLPAYMMAIYHLVVSVILFIEYSMEMDRRNNIQLCNFHLIADQISSYLLLVVLFLTSVSLLTGVMTNQGRFVMPFLALQIMDFILSFLMFFTSYSEIPSMKETLKQNNMAVFKLDTQATEWRYLQLSLRLMITCSGYGEVPTYLNLKPADYIAYFSASMSSEKYIKKMIIFSVLYTAVILYKALMICCTWRFCKGSNELAKNQSKDMFMLKEISKAALPSYKEATKMELKDLPPPYSTV
ncbi:lysosomal-associated transmembrane protein 5 [Bufo bufo]|uniref:lysosomal-associated transmembrane protein 5 n=1 Tax=Bufo bufo TaxID=8384 RepID=UPI001ABDDEF9|nr:lysosomal-associated transmembrane protein 5 [Bufo bufo]